MSIAETKELIGRYPDDCWLPGISSEPGVGFALNTSDLKSLAESHDKLLAAAKAGLDYALDYDANEIVQLIEAAIEGAEK